MLSSILNFFRAVDPYLYKLLGKDMYVALDGAPTSCYVTAGIALSAAVVIAFQAKMRLDSSTDAATPPQRPTAAARSTNRRRESSPSDRRTSITDKGEATGMKMVLKRCKNYRTVFQMFKNKKNRRSLML